MRELIIELPTPDATRAFGRALGELLFPGAVVALVGPLGAGKTFFVRAIAEGLGADPRAVSSPTFVLIQEYQGRWPVYHFDTFRLPNVDAFRELGSADYVAGSGVCLIEWADRVEIALPEQRIWVELAITGDESRRLRFQAVGPANEGVLLLLAAERGRYEATSVNADFDENEQNTI